jgi:hypothetical protein
MRRDAKRRYADAKIRYAEEEFSRLRLQQLQEEQHKLRARAAVEELKREVLEITWLKRPLWPSVVEQRKKLDEERREFEAREVHREVNHANIIESELDEWRKGIKTIRAMRRARKTP